MNMSLQWPRLLLLILLQLPLILFFASWYRTPFQCIPIIICLFYSYNYLKESCRTTIRLSVWDLLLGCILLLAWLLYGGVGQWGYQNFDYMKHNAVSFELSQGTWPVEVKEGQDSWWLVYYLGYYLVPSLLGSWGGTVLMNTAYLLQTFLLLLCILLLTLSTIPKPRPGSFSIITLGLIFFGGFDLLGSWWTKLEHTKLGDLPEWWAGAMTFQYTGMTDLMYWVPQHACIGWALAVLFWREWQLSRFIYLPWLFGIGLLWSPMVLVGALPLAAFLFWHQLNQNFFSQLIPMLLSLFTGTVMLWMMLQYYQLNPHPIPFEWQITRLGLLPWISLYLPFIFSEFLLYWGLLYFFAEQSLRSLLWIIFVPLMLLPLIYFGLYSDLSMRASIIPLFLLFILVLRPLIIAVPPVTKLPIRVLLLLGLLLGSYSAISDGFRAQQLSHIKLPYGPFLQLPIEIRGQYLGIRPEGHQFFWWYPLKKK